MCVGCVCVCGGGGGVWSLYNHTCTCSSTCNTTHNHVLLREAAPLRLLAAEQCNCFGFSFSFVSGGSFISVGVGVGRCGIDRRLTFDVTVTVVVDYHLLGIFFFGGTSCLEHDEIEMDLSADIAAL